MKTTIAVQNIKCGGCVNTITNKLSKIENIQNVQVNKESSSVAFRYFEPEDAFKVREKLRDLGYLAVDDRNTLVSKANSFISYATGKMR
ncbi:hypothetical protein GCM10007103_07750 [Salinimicrobium marinum]|uniref:HMA domain-containing protein n=1 Tax=Salinimicrobium marinum TaxID=680283 RepID=A0A918S8K2_9FLAO|nr:heavy metal-associated domain-containing protein [Salinimicrobium marinum]GHA28552.1 hypothetical protein GCM10007103_07750 [Salinimicrobium marinum]